MIQAFSDTEEVEALWRKLVSEFATWRFFFPRPRDLFVASARLGVDFTRGTFSLTYWRNGEAIIKNLPTDDLLRLKARAAMNLRQADNYLRYMFYLFVSIPIALSLATAQLFPGIWQLVAEENAASFFGVIGVWAFIVFIYFTSAWKARELDTFLTYALAMRGETPDEEDEGEAEGLELPGP